MEPTARCAALPETIEDALARLAEGGVSRVDLTRRCLDRISALDPTIHAWAFVDASGALAAAARGDAEQAASPNDRRARSGKLRGIPIGVKDIIDVAGMPTRAGSPLWVDFVAQRDAPVVAALRRAGAIILGKTVTCELACFDPSPTRNPWNIAHTPGGSSSGSAAAVACGMCLGAIGTQTGGSIIRPAAYCGVAGFKPSFRSTGREGVVPVSLRLDHIGVFARSARDARRLLEAAGLADRAGDGEEPESGRRRKTSAPPRLGAPGGMFAAECGAEMLAMFESALERFRAAGAEIVRMAEPPELFAAIENHRAIMAWDAARTHRQAFADHPAAFGPSVAGLIREGLAIAETEYRRALEHQLSWSAAIDDYLAPVDGLLTPAAPSTAPASLATTGDPRFNVAWSYAGTPAIALPCGIDASGMPAGLQIVGRRGAARRLGQVAEWLERVIDFRARPAIVAGL